MKSKGGPSLQKRRIPSQMATKLIVVVGPTASGKSDLAVQLARKYNGEIISADSRQVYKGLDIGSGKITKKEMRSVRHYLLDVASPKNVFTVARFQKLARKAIKDIIKRGKLPIIAGGTGFYIDSILYETAIPEVKPNAKLRAQLEKYSAAALFAQLEKKDPIRAKTIDPKNKRRLIRALEIIAFTKKPVPALSTKKHSSFLMELGIQPENIQKIGITRSPEELKARIHSRLIKRLRQGMLAEVERLHKEGVSWKRLDDLGLEYRYASRYLREKNRESRIENEIHASSHTRDLKSEMIQSIEKESWQYARRQMTWWRKDKEIKWMEFDH